MKQNLFHVWLKWLSDLGGSYEPIRDLDEKTLPTGRRDPDTKPRSYEVGTHVRGRNPKMYAIKPSGQVVRVD